MPEQVQAFARCFMSGFFLVTLVANVLDKLGYLRPRQVLLMLSSGWTTVFSGSCTLLFR
jgi:hypothetical protein